MGSVTIGVDVGQKRDPTAIAVAEVDRRQISRDRTDCHFIIRHLARLPLGTPYPAVAKEVARITARVRDQAGKTPTVFVDATGVGQPVLDLIQAEGIACRLFGVYFTHGDRCTEDGRKVILGKAYLVSRLQNLLQSGRLHLPRTAEAQVLASELLNYEIRVDENANNRYGAFRVGTHDDLVTALGLGAWNTDARVDGMTEPLVRFDRRHRRLWLISAAGADTHHGPATWALDRRGRWHARTARLAPVEADWPIEGEYLPGATHAWIKNGEKGGLLTAELEPESPGLGIRVYDDTGRPLAASPAGRSLRTSVTFTCHVGQSCQVSVVPMGGREPKPWTRFILRVRPAMTVPDLET